MEAVFFPKLINFHQSTGYYMPSEGNLYTESFENLKPQTKMFTLNSELFIWSSVFCFLAVLLRITPRAKLLNFSVLKTTMHLTVV